MPAGRVGRRQDDRGIGPWLEIQLLCITPTASTAMINTSEADHESDVRFLARY